MGTGSTSNCQADGRRQRTSASPRPARNGPDTSRRDCGRAGISRRSPRAALGARDAIVETGSANPANRLYEGIGLAEAYEAWFWQREWA